MSETGLTSQPLDFSKPPSPHVATEEFTVPAFRSKRRTFLEQKANIPPKPLLLAESGTVSLIDADFSALPRIPRTYKFDADKADLAEHELSRLSLIHQAFLYRYSSFQRLEKSATIFDKIDDSRYLQC